MTTLERELTINLAEVNLLDYVGQTVNFGLYQALAQEMEWRHQGCWTIIGDLQADATFSIVRVRCLPEPRPTAKQYPKLTFTGPQDAQAWGLKQGVFLDAKHAEQAYQYVRKGGDTGQQPKDAATMWRLWIEYVLNRKDEGD
jgi:hypothetical protein